MKDKDIPRIKDEKPRSKQKYDPPQLVIYGDIREITKSVGKKSALPDGGMGGMQKTF